MIPQRTRRSLSLETEHMMPHRWTPNTNTKTYQTQITIIKYKNLPNTKTQIQTKSFFKESLQEADDRELPLIPLVFDILKTPAVWQVQNFNININLNSLHISQGGHVWRFLQWNRILCDAYRGISTTSSENLMLSSSFILQLF